MLIPFHIYGIPCTVRVTHWTAGTDHTFESEGEQPELEYEILDRRGRRAEWLEDKVTKADVAKIWEEYRDAIHDRDG